MAKRKTNEEFVQELKSINDTILPLEEYQGSNHKILCRCGVCGHIWSVMPSGLLSGKGCPPCGILKNTKNRTKSIDDFLSQIKEINPNIILIGNYTNSKQNTRFKCLIDDHEWETSPTNILGGTGCPVCGKVYSPTTEDFIKKMNTINSNIVILGKYNGRKSNIQYTCKIHTDDVFTSTPNTLYSMKYGCPKCNIETSGQRRRLSNEEFQNKIPKGVQCLSTYNKCSDKVVLKCKKCNRIWSITADVAMRIQGCSCSTTSFLEQEVDNFLSCNKIKFVTQKTFEQCRHINLLRFDFYLTDYNMCIECDGEQHYQPIKYFGGEDKFKITQTRDKIKEQYCKDNNIKLIRIPYWEKNNIEQILIKELNLNCQ